MSENWRDQKNFNDFHLSRYRRSMGTSLYSTDVDSLLYSYDKNGAIKLAAIIDYKHGNAEKALNTSAIQAHILLAQNLPFFLVYYWIKPDFEIPMFFVKAANPSAKTFLLNYKYESGNQPLLHNGKWFSAYEYTRFNYLLRGMTFYPSSRLQKETNERVSSLSKEYKIYPLPEFHI